MFTLAPPFWYRPTGGGLVTPPLGWDLATVNAYDSGFPSSLAYSFSVNNRRCLLIAGGGNASVSVAAPRPRKAGKYYWEVLAGDNSAGRPELGWVAESGLPFNAANELRSDTAVTGYSSFCVAVYLQPYEPDGLVYRFSGSAAPTLSGSAVNKVFRFAVDISAGNIWIGIDSAWHAGGDPSAGTGPTLTGSPLTPGRPAAYTDNHSASNGSFIGNFRTSELAYAPPTGFLPWGDPDTTANDYP